MITDQEVKKMFIDLSRFDQTFQSWVQEHVYEITEHLHKIFTLFHTGHGDQALAVVAPRMEAIVKNILEQKMITVELTEMENQMKQKSLQMEKESLENAKITRELEERLLQQKERNLLEVDRIKQQHDHNIVNIDREKREQKIQLQNEIEFLKKTKDLAIQEELVKIKAKFENENQTLKNECAEIKTELARISKTNELSLQQHLGTNREKYNEQLQDICKVKENEIQRLKEECIRHKQQFVELKNEMQQINQTYQNNKNEWEINAKRNETEETVLLREHNRKVNLELIMLTNRIEQIKLETKNEINQEKLLANKTQALNNERIATQYQEKIGSYLERYMTAQPAVKGKEAEFNYETTLNMLFPTGEVKRLAKESHSCDIELSLSESNIKVLFEIKNYKNNVPKTQIDKFHHDIKHKKSHGIMISVESGISARKNFQIDFVTDDEQKQYIALYLPQHQNNNESLVIAVNMLTFIAEWLEKSQKKAEKDAKMFDGKSMEKILKAVESIQQSYITAKQALEKAKNTLDEQNITQLQQLLGLETKSVNLTDIVEKDLTLIQEIVLREIAPKFKPVKNWSVTGKTILHSSLTTSHGTLREILSDLGGTHLNEKQRIDFLRGKAMRMREWQNRKECK